MTTGVATSRDSTPVLDQLRLTSWPPPHWHGVETGTAVTWAWILAASLPAISAVMNYGEPALAMIVISIVTSLVTEGGICLVLSNRVRTGPGWESHALLTGLLVALTLPYKSGDWFWQTPIVASVSATLIGRVLGGGHGNYLWQPVAIGRVFVQLVFASSVTYGLTTVPVRAHAPSAVEALVSLAGGSVAFQEPGRSPVTVLIRDYLPPWGFSLFGLPTEGVGPPLGGGTIVLLVSCLFLAWRGHVRLECVIAAIAAATAAAILLPISSGPDGGLIWAPGLTVDEGLLVGLVYVLYHLTSGELPLVVLLLAGDTVCSPLTSRGQRWFGVGIGALTILLRMHGMAEMAGYWALLAMNTLVPLIDRYSRRRVLGAS